MGEVNKKTDAFISRSTLSDFIQCLPCTHWPPSFPFLHVPWRFVPASKNLWNFFTGVERGSCKSNLAIRVTLWRLCPSSQHPGITVNPIRVTRIARTFAVRLSLRFAFFKGVFSMYIGILRISSSSSDSSLDPSTSRAD